MSDNYLKVFYANKSTGKMDCNFDLKELTENFSIFNFINDARKRPSEDFGGFLICTPKQYIFGYNSSFGIGSHGASFGRAMKDILGGGNISNEGELLRLASECERTYFCARLLYECVGYNHYQRPIFKGSLAFLTAKPINEEMFQTFKKFIEDYGQEINLAVSTSGGSFDLTYYSKEKRKSIHTNDLNEVYSYVESHIDYDYKVNIEEEIIGVSTNSQTLK